MLMHDLHLNHDVYVIIDYTHKIHGPVGYVRGRGCNVQTQIDQQ